MLTFNILSLFSGTIEARTLNFGIHYDNGTRDYESWREGGGGGGYESGSLLLVFPFRPFFHLFGVNLYHSFLRSFASYNLQT